jgi:hypothetical protein
MNCGARTHACRVETHRDTSLGGSKSAGFSARAMLLWSLPGIDTSVDAARKSACATMATSWTQTLSCSKSSAIRTMAVALVLCSTLCAAPRLFYSKYFKGSVPEFVAITVERDGQVTYQEAKDDDNPIHIQLDSAAAQELFDLTEKLGRFQRPLESGLKIANLGAKTFRFEDGAEHHEIQFNYSEDVNAQTLLDRFERITETEQHYVNLDRTAHFEKLGVNDVLLQIQASWERNRLVAPEQFLPLLDRIAKNESYLHISRELAAAIAEAIRKPAHSAQERAQ